MKTTKQESSSKKEKDHEAIHSTTADPTKPDSETSHKKTHKIGDPIKKQSK